MGVLLNGLVKEPGGCKKQVQARGKTPRSQSLFFAAPVPSLRVLEFFGSPIAIISLAENGPVAEFFAARRMIERHARAMKGFFSRPMDTIIPDNEMIMVSMNRDAGRACFAFGHRPDIMTP